MPIDCISQWGKVDINLPRVARAIHLYARVRAIQNSLQDPPLKRSQEAETSSFSDNVRG